MELDKQVILEGMVREILDVQTEMLNTNNTEDGKRRHVQNRIKELIDKEVHACVVNENNPEEFQAI